MMSAFPPSSRRPQPQVEEDNTPNDDSSNRKKRKCKAENVIATEAIWKEYIKTSIKIIEDLPTSTPLLAEGIGLDAFTTEKNNDNRYDLTKTGESFFPFRIFPWLLAPCRLRQNLALESPLKHSTTIDDVISAANYFFQRVFSTEDVADLKAIYEEMMIPIASNSLTNIVVVHKKFVKAVAPRLRRHTQNSIDTVSKQIEMNCERIGRLRALMPPPTEDPTPFSFDPYDLAIALPPTDPTVWNFEYEVYQTEIAELSAANVEFRNERRRLQDLL
jgi:hypothetical protein